MRPPCAIIKFELGGKTISFARNPKCATSTAVNYIAQILWNEKPNQTVQKIDFEQHGIYYEYTHGRLDKCDIRIAPFRDPVEKLYSGFNYCLEYLPEDITYLDFLKDYEKYMDSHDYIREHCSSNYDNLGERDSYNVVYESEEIDNVLLPLLSELSGVKIQPSVIRRAKYRKQTRAEIRLSEQIMEIDYHKGWKP